MNYQKIPRFVLIMISPRQHPGSGTRRALSHLVPSVATQQLPSKLLPTRSKYFTKASLLFVAPEGKLPISEED